jgi:hypothetical protein
MRMLPERFHGKSKGAGIKRRVWNVVTENKASDERQAYEKSTESLSADSTAKAATEKGNTCGPKEWAANSKDGRYYGQNVEEDLLRRGTAGRQGFRCNLADWQQKQRAEREGKATI